MKLKKRNIITAIVLALALLLGAVLFLWTIKPLDNEMPASSPGIVWDANAEEGGLAHRSEEEIRAELNEKVAQIVYAFSNQIPELAVLFFLDPVCLNLQIDLCAVFQFAVQVQTLSFFVSILRRDFVVPDDDVRNLPVDESTDQVYQRGLGIRRG